MLTKIIKWLTAKQVNIINTKLEDKAPVVVPRSQHNISRKNISKNALKVLYRLKDAGYQGYLVGGGIRDLLLGIQPKDFDIATNAMPEQVRKLFRNCRLIGRRFRLAHIYFGAEIIEVATFRANHSLEHQTETGMLLRDNVYGTIADDALRRDFTINAIYYNIYDFSLVDYVNGLEDINKRQLRIIGDPNIRYREDPVRMLRAIRFAAKLQLTIHPDTANPIRNLAMLLTNVSAARLFDEYLKLFSTGKVTEIFQQLIDYGLYVIMFPQAAPFLQDKIAINFIKVTLINTEERIALEKPISPIFILAVLLWWPFWLKTQQLANKRRVNLEIQQHAFNSIMHKQRQIIMIPKRLMYQIKDIWYLQFKLTKLTVYDIVKCYKMENFRLAYDFLLLRAQAGDHTVSQEAKWWNNYVASNDKTRKIMLKELVKTKSR